MKKTEIGWKMERHGSKATVTTFYKPKPKKALWTKIHPPKVKAKRKPLRQRSKAMEKKMAEYQWLRITYLKAQSECMACALIQKPSSSDWEIMNWRPRLATEIHHRRGKISTLLNDVRYWMAICRPCHNWIGDHKDEARTLGLLCQRGDWNKP